MKSFPYNLNELKLVKCQISSSEVIDEMLDFLEEQCYLSSLALVSVKLSEAGLAMITRMA
jgi:hypothetical protein